MIYYVEIVPERRRQGLFTNLILHMIDRGINKIWVLADWILSPDETT